jgi:ribosomal protein S18 acetylase RimI-like enzyme
MTGATNGPMTGATPGPVRLRPGTPADLPAMADVFVAAWRGGYRGMVPDAVIDAWTPATALAELAGGDGVDVVATDDAGTVIGFARYQPDAGYVASLYVTPAAGGRGAGRALLQHALDAMPGRDVTLWVFEANARARDLYTRAGFHPDGARLTDPRWRTPQIRLRREAPAGAPRPGR